MNIKRKIETPTGHILIVEGEHGLLECLSLGDYGKDVNIKCDVLGLDRVPSPVRHTALLPLTEKWVATLSTQYGCSMGCAFCDVPKVGPGRNATTADLLHQLDTVLSLHPEIEHTDRLNVHFARMGEPSWNPSVLKAAMIMKVRHAAHRIHPVVSTMMPKRNTKLRTFIEQWLDIKNNNYEGEAGLQLSINSTSDQEREEMFSGNASTLAAIAAIMGPAPHVRGRKITLNFAVANYTIDPEVLLRHFDPRYYLVKLTPMHKTTSALANNIKTDGEYTEYYPYLHHEEALRRAGYDVLVFIASKEEDESRITCGNAILSDGR